MLHHIIKRFDRELDQLREHILSMGGFVERAIRHSMQSMLDQDDVLARKTIKRDKIINAMEIQCDNMTRNILARRQPAAGDLRFIVTSIKVVTDLERIGDLAAGIAQGVLNTSDNPPRNSLTLEIMAEDVQRQVNHALDAFSRADVDLAISVLTKHEGIERLQRSIYREILTYMAEDQRLITSSIILSSAANNLKSISSHARNIAEMVIYMTRGHDIRHVDHEAAARILEETSQQNMPGSMPDHHHPEQGAAKSIVTLVSRPDRKPKAG